MNHLNSVEFKVYGKYALFTDPLTKIGGEKFSYQIPTYEALKGITESIYWKPTFKWVIDDVRIMNRIELFDKGMLLIHYQDDGKGLSIYTYLKDVEYHVRAHFEWNDLRPDLAQDRNENKHWDIAKRMIERGGRRDIFLGTRECQGYVEPCPFTEGSGEYDDLDELTFGVMVHGITYPDEDKEHHMKIRLWRPKMIRGVVHFIRPDECDPKMVRDLGERKVKPFELGKNFSGISEFDREGVF
jgi:CRISPR-associated protein Cas5d